MDELEKRKEAVLNKLKGLKNNQENIAHVLLGIIIYIGAYIRTRNLGIIQWQYPIDPDSFAFLRYARYIVEHGQLMQVDMLRYYPLGWSNLSEFRVLSYFIAYLYKFLKIFIPNITVANTDVIYPVICFSIGIISFYLFVKKLFNWKTALVSSAFLVVMPAYLYRTMAGAADKEAFAMMTLFAALYFFISAWKAKEMKPTIIFSVLAGIATALTGAVWGGVIFLFLTFATFALINLLLERIDKKKTAAFTLWFLSTAVFLNQLYPERFYWINFISSIQLTATVFVFFSILAYYTIQNTSLKSRLNELTKNKIPQGLLAIIITTLLGLIAVSIIKGPSNIIYQIKETIIQLTEPFGTSRWSLTVAEAHLTSFMDWKGQFTLRALIIALAGATLAFHNMTKGFKKKRLIATGVFLLSLTGISISRYSPSSAVLNGSTPLSKLIYFGSLIAIIGTLVYTYYKTISKDKEKFQILQNIGKSELFAIILTIWMAISAKTAIRLLFVFAPAVAILIGYFASDSLKKLKSLKNDTYKLAGIIVLAILLSITFVGFYKASVNQATYTGSSYTYQWVQGMNWVKENTPEDAVLAHWWDYGYYVQTGGERATLSDGGNSRGAINYFTGRHMLTAQNETEALELLKANEATHLLIIYEEINKYPAFSSIGSDANYDRYSWISTFTLDPSLTQETRNQTILAYRGGFALDEDFIWQDKLYPQGAAGIGAVLIPIETSTENNSATQKIKQPSIIIGYQGQQVQVPLECIFIENEEMIFPEKGYPGCLRIIPTIDSNNQANPQGAGLLLSPKVRRTLFTKLFLYDQESENFKKVYSDQDTGMPLALYQGRIIGPMKIWEISYPDNLDIPEMYYGDKVPDPAVEKV